MTKDPIDFFDGTDYDFLSNFHPSPITWRGHRWPTVEHAYQAMKAPSPLKQDWVRFSRTPGVAKYRGRTLKKLRPDWNAVKYDFMLELVREKFKQNPKLAAKLLATGDRELIEGNTWGDRIWGKTRNAQDVLIGQNWLGEILMKVRSELSSWHKAHADASPLGECSPWGGTVTGRMTSSVPNIEQVNPKTPEGEAIRNAFTGRTK